MQSHSKFYNNINNISRYILSMAYRLMLSIFYQI